MVVDHILIIVLLLIVAYLNREIGSLRAAVVTLHYRLSDLEYPVVEEPFVPFGLLPPIEEGNWSISSISDEDIESFFDTDPYLSAELEAALDEMDVWLVAVIEYHENNDLPWVPLPPCNCDQCQGRANAETQPALYFGSTPPASSDWDNCMVELQGRSGLTIIEATRRFCAFASERPYDWYTCMMIIRAGDQSWLTY